MAHTDPQKRERWHLRVHEARTLHSFWLGGGGDSIKKPFMSRRSMRKRAASIYQIMRSTLSSLIACIIHPEIMA